MVKITSKVTTILFDFDGTLADTFSEIVKIYNKIAPAYNCRPVDLNDLDYIRSKRPQELLRDYNISTYNLPFVILKGRKELRTKIHEIASFGNLVDIILQLKEKGYQLGILSANSRKNIKAFLANHKIEDAFDFIHNSKNIFGKSKKIKKILKEYHLKHNQVLMVGDETRDIEAAKKMDVPIVAVGWGFNSINALMALQPNYWVTEPSEIIQVVEQL
ncbi:HAD-IA family hydrolase [Bacteroidales bacterium]|nr:HAD-IA family hydrolase [Bacteroidales bacterium]